MLSIKFDDTYLNKNQISHSVKPAKMKVKSFGCSSETDIIRKKRDAWGQERKELKRLPGRTGPQWGGDEKEGLDLDTPRTTRYHRQ